MAFSSAPLTQTTTHSQSTWADVVQLMFVDLPHFLPALKFQSLTGMVDVKCMTVVLISACLYGDLERGGVWEKNQGASFRNQRCLLVASGGMLYSSDRIVSPSVCECPFASTSALLMMPLDVRWLLYNVHSHT